ncbi:MAG TPA: hypothetical protein VFY10_14010 [Dehalococcoidia bacterium]|nr:hypothetical protein [Dehalococcoidia bacterium]
MMERCPVCGQVAEMIWVRAHYQCAACGQVVMACCNGETALACPLDADAPRSEPRLVAPNAKRSIERPGEGN